MQASGRFCAAIVVACYLTLVLPVIADSGKSQRDLGETIVIGWNDLGMHCMNASFQHLAVLPPFNTIWAQVIYRGELDRLPQILLSDLTIDYAFQNNTYSVGKTDFWSFEDQLFGVSLPDNIGLTGHGLTGQMAQHGSGWSVEGVPLTPYDDSNWSIEVPYQLADLTLKNSVGTTLDMTTIVAPVSTEMHCEYCHTGGSGTEVAILQYHDEEESTDLINNQPVLCANCHASNALGMPGTPGVPSLSLAMHKKHGEENVMDCYVCHPGTTTQCFRDVHRQHEMTCQSCHGSTIEVYQSIEDGREPWLEEPNCGTCHGAGHAAEPGMLYRNSRGHGGVYCEACHGSPHAIYPTLQPRDNLQSIRLQNHAGKIDDCRVCHGYTPTEPGPHGFLAPQPAVPIDNVSVIVIILAAITFMFLRFGNRH